MRTVTAVMALSLASCGGNPDSFLFPADIPGNRAVDGFVTRTAPPGTENAVVLALDNDAVQAGTDPATFSESRAFLDFSLDGEGGVPPGARIQSANLHMFVSRIDVATESRFPLVLEIVAPFAPLDASDFDAPAVPGAAVTWEVFPSRDRGNFVDTDVAPLLTQAIGAGFRRLELRVRPAPPPSASGLVQIEDMGIFDTAPRLQVEYFRN